MRSTKAVQKLATALALYIRHLKMRLAPVKAVLAALCLMQLLLLQQLAAAQNFKLVDTGSRLGARVGGHRVAYDGADSIYVIGGFIGGAEQVQRYSLRTGAVHEVGRFIAVYGGAATTYGTDVVYFGGYQAGGLGSTVFQFTTTTGEYTLVNALPARMDSMGMASQPDSPLTYLFGGWSAGGRLDLVLRYNASNHEIMEVTRLPEALADTAAVWDARRNVAYIFGGSGSDILEFDPLGHISKLDTSLPYDPARSSCAVYADVLDEVFIVGGAELVRFRPDEGSAARVPVDGWPDILQDTACTYVPQSNRIYILGGIAGFNGESQTLRDEIWYIDLDSDAVGR